MPSRAVIVELEHILDQRIPFCSLPQLLHDEFLRGKEVLVVAGTHGKTTTTSMLAWIFHSAGMQPSFLIGGIAENFGSSFHLGQGKHFILEGDEYDTAFFDKGPKFLHYFPDAIILTSVEFDHADIYKDLDAVETAFKRLVNLIPRRGRIVAFDGAAGEATESASLQRCLRKLSARSNVMAPAQRADWKVTNLKLDPATHLLDRVARTANRGPISSSPWPANTTSGTQPPPPLWRSPAAFRKKQSPPRSKHSRA